MKEGFIIKANWLVYRSAILKYLPLLGAKDSKKTFRSAKAIYCSEMKLLPEYEKYDVLKLNLSHAVMLSAIYERYGITILNHVGQDTFEEKYCSTLEKRPMQSSRSVSYYLIRRNLWCKYGVNRDVYHTQIQ